MMRIRKIGRKITKGNKKYKTNSEYSKKEGCEQKYEPINKKSRQRVNILKSNIEIKSPN